MKPEATTPNEQKASFSWGLDRVAVRGSGFVYFERWAGDLDEGRKEHFASELFSGTLPPHWVGLMKRRRFTSLWGCIFIFGFRVNSINTGTAQPGCEMVGWQGLEPWTNALKGHCSTN